MAKLNVWRDAGFEWLSETRYAEQTILMVLLQSPYNHRKIVLLVCSIFNISFEISYYKVSFGERN